MYLFDVDGYLLWVPVSRSLIEKDLLNGIWTAISDHVSHDASRYALPMRELCNHKAVIDELVSMCTTASLAERRAEFETQVARGCRCIFRLSGYRAYPGR